MIKRQYLIISFTLFLLSPIVVNGCKHAAHTTEDKQLLAGNLNRVFLNPDSEKEKNDDIQMLIQKGYIPKDSPVFPVLEIYKKKKYYLTKEKHIHLPNSYIYFVKLNEKKKHNLRNVQNKTKKISPVQIYEVSEKADYDNERFNFKYNIDTIKNDSSAISDEKMKEIKDTIFDSYKKENKKIKGIEILFQSEWLFNWRIYVIRVFLEGNKEESFAIIDKTLNVKEVLADRENMEITHCLGSDKSQFFLEAL